MKITEITTVKQQIATKIRLAAYCRVSSDSTDQLHSFAAQIRYYSEYTKANPEYELVGIYADEGLTGTEMKKRDELNRLLKDCQKGKIDRIIVKSVSRFARNTEELLVTLRLLKDFNVCVYFEEQGIDTDKLNMEMIVTFPGMAAQQESVNISGNMRWSYQKRMQSGEFNCTCPAYGYRLVKGEMTIEETEAIVVRRIFNLYLQGHGTQAIANILNDEVVPRRYGHSKWHSATIKYILTNERYMGDVLLQKKFTTETLPFRQVRNKGQMPQYYVENSNPPIVSRETYEAVQELLKSRNNHPAIIDSLTFSRVQEEIARRNSKKKVKQKGSKTEQGRYSSKYALTELLVCGECKTPYRRCTWTISGQKKIVWRCISRLDFGKKYCHNSPSIEESVLHRAIMRAIMDTALKNSDVLKMLKLHIGMGFEENTTEDNALNIQVRIAEIDAEFKAMLSGVSSDTVDAFDDAKASALITEKTELQKQLEQLHEIQQKRINTKHRLDDIYTILDGLKNRPMEYDDQMVRQILECVTVDSKEQITVIFIGGLKIKQSLLDC